MKKRKVDSVLNYTFSTNAHDIIWHSRLSTFNEGWEKKKATRGEVASLIRHLVTAIQQDLVDIAESTINVPDKDTP